MVGRKLIIEGTADGVNLTLSDYPIPQVAIIDLQVAIMLLQKQMRDNSQAKIVVPTPGVDLSKVRMQ